MGDWDELCLICGLTPGGGPDILFDDLDEWTDGIVYDLQELGLDLDLNEDELRQKIRKLLLMFYVGDNEPTPYKKAIKDGSISHGPWFPFKDERWDGWEAIAIGIFDENHEYQSPPPKGYVSYIRPLFPPLTKSQAVTSSFVRYPSGHGGLFEGVDDVDEDVMTDASTHNYNFSVYVLLTSTFSPGSTEILFLPGRLHSYSNLT
jgi:hypothetical protein